MIHRALLSGLLLVGGMWLGTRTADGADEPAPAPRAVDGRELRKELDARRGKVVLLNFWATWCGPCKEEIPDLVRLQKDLGEKGLVILGMSMDETKDRQAVLDLIREEKINYSIFVRKAGADGSIARLVDPIDRKFAGSIPATYVFDRAGKQSGAPLSGLQDYDDLRKAVEPLLAP